MLFLQIILITSTLISSTFSAPTSVVHGQIGQEEMVEDGWVLVPEGQTGMSSLKDGIVEDELEKASDFGDSLGSSTFHTPINGQPVGTKNHAKPAHDSAQDLVGKASSKDEIIQEELERTSPSNPNKSDVEEKIKHAFSSDMKEENAEDGPKPASLSNSNGENFEDQLNQAPRVNQGQHELAPRFREAQFGLDRITRHWIAIVVIKTIGIRLWENFLNSVELPLDQRDYRFLISCAAAFMLQYVARWEF